ncbi:MAG TPA: low molecular weight phosphatase family protein [Deltaproteobacteria bacterium]|jgi:arsenate reductase|nr:low molecular weight phosphatase family protein [Deltaproteobacteria bacterium]
MDTVIFACVHSAGRSQIAAAWFNRLADPAKATALSAGTRPGAHVHPEVVAAMSEVSVDLSQAKPQLLSDALARRATLLVTMGCGEECPALPRVQREDWLLEDPKGKPIEAVRQIRDEILKRVEHLIESRGWARGRGTRVRR